MNKKIILKKHHDIYRVSETQNIMINQKSFTKKEVEVLIEEKAGKDFIVIIKR